MKQAISDIDSLDLPKNRVKPQKLTTTLPIIAQHRIKSLKRLIISRRETGEYSDKIALEFTRVGINLIAYIADIKNNEPPDDTRYRMGEFAEFAGIKISNEPELKIDEIISSPLYINAQNAGHAVDLTITEWRAYGVKYLFPTGCTAERVKELRDERKREYDRAKKERKRRTNGSRPLSQIIGSSWRAYCAEVNIPERTLRYHRHKGRDAVIRFIQRKCVALPSLLLLDSIPLASSLKAAKNDTKNQK